MQICNPSRSHYKPTTLWFSKWLGMSQDIEWCWNQINKMRLLFACSENITYNSVMGLHIGTVASFAYQATSSFHSLAWGSRSASARCLLPIISRVQWVRVRSQISRRARLAWKEKKSSTTQNQLLTVFMFIGVFEENTPRRRRRRQENTGETNKKKDKNKNKAKFGQHMQREQD